MKISIKEFKESLSKNLCPFCNSEMKFYDGSLGYEANKCDCGFYTDHTGLHIEEAEEQKGKVPDYKKAYNILMDYWEYIPNEDKPKAHAELEKVGL